MDFLIAGLGNPGEKYSRTRHNIGFRFLDQLAERCGHFEADWRQWRRGGGEGVTRSGNLAGKSVMLVKPLTYMNRSGDVVSAVLRYHQLDPSQLIVAHDEVDLEFTRLKMKLGGGHGGHNGIRSVEGVVGSRDFYRLRLGIGRPAQSIALQLPLGAESKQRIEAGISEKGLTDWVLGRFSSQEEQELENFLGRSADALLLFLESGLEAAQRHFH